MRLAPGTLALAIGLVVCGCGVGPRGPLAELEPPQRLAAAETGWFELGRHLLETDRPDMAHQAFLRSLRIEGVSAAALTGAAIAAERRGLLGEAHRLLERARRIEPGSAAVHNNFGLVLYRRGATQEARDAFRTALALSGGADAAAARNLRRSEAEMRDGITDPPAAHPHRLERLGKARFRLMAASDQPENG